MWTASYLRFEGIGISLQNRVNTFLPISLIFYFIVAIGAVTSITIGTRGKAITVPVGQASLPKVQVQYN